MAGDGQAMLLENLRVHLDLQLEPAATAAVPTGSWSGQQPEPAATERAAPRRARGRASATPAYQQWAVLVALTSLLLALASWWVGGEPAQPTAEPTDATSNMSLLPEPAGPRSAAPAMTPAAEPPVVVVPVLAPAPAATAQGSAPEGRPAATPAAGTPRPPAPAPGPRTRPSSSAGGAKSVALAGERAGATLNGKPPAARGSVGGAAAPRLANSDLLDLFGDTK